MPKVRDEIYFCLYLTENEHYIVESMIEKFCGENDLILKYYRKLKDGHVPCYREIKVVGPGASYKIANYFADEKITTEENPWKKS